MSTKRSMLLLMLVLFVGTVAGKSILPKSPKLCIPCTNYARPTQIRPGACDRDLR